MQCAYLYSHEIASLWESTTIHSFLMLLNSKMSYEKWIIFYLNVISRIICLLMLTNWAAVWCAWYIRWRFSSWFQLKISFEFSIFIFHKCIEFRTVYDILCSKRNWFYCNKSCELWKLFCLFVLFTNLLQELLNDIDAIFLLKIAISKSFYHLANDIWIRFALFIIPIKYIHFFFTPSIMAETKT